MAVSLHPVPVRTGQKAEKHLGQEASASQVTQTMGNFKTSLFGKKILNSKYSAEKLGSINQIQVFFKKNKLLFCIPF